MEHNQKIFINFISFKEAIDRIMEKVESDAKCRNTREIDHNFASDISRPIKLYKVDKSHRTFSHKKGKTTVTM